MEFSSARINGSPKNMGDPLISVTNMGLTGYITYFVSNVTSVFFNLKSGPILQHYPNTEKYQNLISHWVNIYLFMMSPRGIQLLGDAFRGQQVNQGYPYIAFQQVCDQLLSF